MAMRLPRMPRISRADLRKRSSPSKTIRPVAISPGGMVIRRMIERAVTLFPQPDSPTKPNVSPRLIANDTRSTATNSAALQMKAGGKLLNLEDHLVACAHTLLLMASSKVSRGPRGTQNHRALTSQSCRLEVRLQWIGDSDILMTYSATPSDNRHTGKADQRDESARYLLQLVGDLCVRRRLYLAPMALLAGRGLDAGEELGP